MISRLEVLLATRADIVFASVFGSILDRDAVHDLDLAIWTAPAADSRVDLELAASLSNALGLPVDVRRVNDAPVPFLFKVLRGRRVAVRDESFVANLMERVAREYHDMAPLLRQATREAFAR